MNTLHHGFWTIFLFRNSAAWFPALLGGVFPDVAYAVGFLWAKFVEGLGFKAAVFRALALSSVAWGAVALHSLVIWGIVVIVTGLWIRKWTGLVFFSLGWGFHLLIDALTHITDAHPLFWPISPVRPAGLVSYWEREYGSLGFAWVNGTLIVVAALYMVWDHLRRRVKRSGLRAKRR